MKKIPLWNTKKKFALVDDKDFHKILDKSIKWYLFSGAAMTCIYHGGGSRKDAEYERVSMARWLMGSPKNRCVDHINGDRLDNRRVNLRVCSKKENNRNTKIRKDNKTGYKGVTKIKSTGKYWAYIRVNGKTQNLGRFFLPLDAAKAYNRAAKTYFGEFARLNTEK